MKKSIIKRNIFIFAVILSVLLSVIPVCAEESYVPNFDYKTDKIVILYVEGQRIDGYDDTMYQHTRGMVMVPVKPIVELMGDKYIDLGGAAYGSEIVAKNGSTVKMSTSSVYVNGQKKSYKSSWINKVHHMDAGNIQELFGYDVYIFEDDIHVVVCVGSAPKSNKRVGTKNAIATKDLERNAVWLEKYLGFERVTKTNAVLAPEGTDMQKPYISIIMDEVAEYEEIITIYGWDEKQYKGIRQTVSKVLKFYFGKDYMDLYNIIDASWGAGDEDKVIAEPYTNLADNRCYAMIWDGDEENLKIYITEKLKVTEKPPFHKELSIAAGSDRKANFQLLADNLGLIKRSDDSLTYNPFEQSFDYWQIWVINDRQNPNGEVIIDIGDWSGYMELVADQYGKVYELNIDNNTQEIVRQILKFYMPKSYTRVYDMLQDIGSGEGEEYLEDMEYVQEDGRYVGFKVYDGSNIVVFISEKV